MHVQCYIYIVHQFAKLFSPTTYDEAIRQTLTLPNIPAICGYKSGLVIDLFIGHYFVEERLKANILPWVLKHH